jgi:hypothetical protein
VVHSAASHSLLLHLCLCASELEDLWSRQLTTGSVSVFLPPFDLGLVLCFCGSNVGQPGKGVAMVHALFLSCTRHLEIQRTNVLFLCNKKGPLLTCHVFIISVIGSHKQYRKPTHSFRRSHKKSICFRWLTKGRK